jgi:hypothetical protein
MTAENRSRKSRSNPINAFSFIFLSVLILSGCREPNVGQSKPEVSPSSGSSLEAAGKGEGSPQKRSGAQAQSASLCNVETLQGQLFGAEVLGIGKSPHRVRGWLGHQGGVSPDRPLLVIANMDGTPVREIPVKLAMKRPDVAQAFPSEVGLETSGFEVVLDSSGLDSGLYRLYLSYMIGEQHFSCDNGRRIRLGS